MSAQMLVASLGEVGTVLRLERDAWLVGNWPRQAKISTPPPPNTARTSKLLSVLRPKKRLDAPQTAGPLASFALDVWYAYNTKHDSRHWPQQRDVFSLVIGISFSSRAQAGLARYGHGATPYDTLSTVMLAGVSFSWCLQAGLCRSRWP